MRTSELSKVLTNALNQISEIEPVNSKNYRVTWNGGKVEHLTQKTAAKFAKYANKIGKQNVQISKQN
jgi:hypothetical protein